MYDRILYLDNFRGFKDTFIPLKDVNFLVGENSTGKTSILLLMKILSKPLKRLLNFIDFDDEEITNIIANFNDIVYGNADKASNFKVGFCVRLNVVDDFYLILFKFVNHEGSPLIDEISVQYRKEFFYCKVTNFKIQFEKRDLDDKNMLSGKNLMSSDDNVFENMLDAFRNWINNLLRSQKKKLKMVSSGKVSSPNDDMYDFKRIDMLLDIESAMERYSTLHFRHLISGQLWWFSPIRVKPKRVYEYMPTVNFTSDGAHTPYLLAKHIDNKGLFGNIKKFGKLSGMYDAVKVKRFGNDEYAPFELDITLNGKDLKITNVGYGVSQVLPIITDIYFLGGKRIEWFAIQQPEIHLHPKAQSAFGAFLFDVNKQVGNKFLIETHSNYIVDRFRICQSKSKKKSNAQVLFFEKTPSGENKVHIIDINDKGQYPEDQPDSFTRFFIEEGLTLLEI
jgi:hypothetical protein